MPNGPMHQMWVWVMSQYLTDLNFKSQFSSGKRTNCSFFFRPDITGDFLGLDLTGLDGGCVFWFNLPLFCRGGLRIYHCQPAAYYRYLLSERKQVPPNKAAKYYRQCGSGPCDEQMNDVAVAVSGSDVWFCRMFSCGHASQLLFLE